MGRKKRKEALKAEIAPQPDVQTDGDLRPVEAVEKAQTENVPRDQTPQLSPLTIALQKERGVYKKRKPHCPPQNQRWSKEYVAKN